MLSDRERGYVAWFDDYVEDTHRFITDVVRPEQPRVFMLAHSLGGGVAVQLLDSHPEDVQVLALSSPMLEINTGSYPGPIAATLASGVCDATDGSAYAIGSGPWQEETDFPGNTVTNSEPRFRWKVQQLKDDATIRLGGYSWRWICQALLGSSRAAATGRFSSTPTLLLQAGNDSIVSPGGQKKYCADAPRCTLSRFEGAKHELLQESDEVRNLALSQVVKFFDAQVTP
jgi:lysophospholipase